MKAKTDILRYFLVLAVSLLSACDSQLDEETTLSFVGDSIIARWDLQSSFSSWITYNLGVSGSGIGYIEDLSGRMTGRNVVLLIGTNDSRLMADPETRREYEEKYVDAIVGLRAEKTYLFEVLPRDFSGDDPAVNDHIRAFNEEIAAKISAFPSITYLKVYDDFTGADGKIREEYYNDGLHLSPQGYEILASCLFKNI